MRVNRKIACSAFPCNDVKHECYIVPNVEVNPDDVSVVLIAEAAPPDPGD